MSLGAGWLPILLVLVVFSMKNWWVRLASGIVLGVFFAAYALCVVFGSAHPQPLMVLTVLACLAVYTSEIRRIFEKW